eukprot:CAMPEP_0204590080 /NCGR_PEP_ID=MMETSP0661-20131031/49576_1 /ASSEMBLY_ACC=CAM_ASM_000606 /TAXON_ID=109239 /ORGANISM="Alexandrium margalefi, Strain AMGDE01CS-322" /LENGTH=317 /DNA_ID=CAMNT_0051600077 /DNA_START=298 /DNA_END=1252 /DNA_ORIENTATION=+
MWVHVAGDHRGPTPEVPLAALPQDELRDVVVGVVGPGIAVIVRQVGVEEQDPCAAELERRPSDGTLRVLIVGNRLPAASSILIGNLAGVVQDRVLEVRARHNLVTGTLSQLVLVLALLRANNGRADVLDQAPKPPYPTIMVAFVLRVVGHDTERTPAPARGAPARGRPLRGRAAAARLFVICLALALVCARLGGRHATVLHPTTVPLRTEAETLALAVGVAFLLAGGGRRRAHPAPHRVPLICRQSAQLAITFASLLDQLVLDIMGLNRDLRMLEEQLARASAAQLASRHTFSSSIADALDAMQAKRITDSMVAITT